MQLCTYKKNTVPYLKRALLALVFFVAPQSVFAASFTPDLSLLVAQATGVAEGVGMFAQASGEYLTTTSRAFAHDAARTTNAIIATTKLPLDFITTSAGDYLNFTQGVGKTLTQNVTDASHASANLYRGAFAFTTDTSKSLATTLANEVDTLRTVATNAGTLFEGTQNTIVTTANTAITSLGRTSHALVTLAAQTADHGVTTLNDTLTSATSFITTTADTIASRTQNTTLAFNPQHQTAALLPGATEVLQSGYDAIYNFWGRFLNTVVPTTPVTPPPATPVTPTPPQLVSVPAPPVTPTTINRTVVTQPVIERTIERTRVLSGVTATDLAAQIAALRAELLAELARSQTTTQSKAVADNNALYLAMAPMNRINNLSSPTISSPTITNATISSGSLSGSFSGTVDGTSGSFTTLGVGTTSPSDTFAVNGVTYLASVSAPAVTNNRLYNIDGDLYWGASVIGGGGVGSWTLNGSDVTWTTGNVGIGTTSPYATLSVVGTSVLGTVTSGTWNGTAITDSYIDFGTASGQVSATDLPITDTGSYFPGITANANAVLQHLGQGINERWSSGVVSGGAITTATGNMVDITSGVGYIGSTRITWNASTSVAMLQNGDNWVSIDSTGAVRIDTSEPSIDNYIRLGYVYTTASNTVVGLAVSTPSYSGNYESRNNNFVMKGIGAVVQSGNIVGTTSTPLNIQATSGTINSNLKEFNVADVSTFTKWYNSADNGWVTDTADNLVNTTKYNVTTNNQATALVTMTASYWKKDLILRTLDGNLHYIYGQTEHATEQDAKDAALPSIPTAITNGGSAYLATAVVQNGDTTLADRLYDIRPNLARVFGFGTSGTTGSIATHSALSGLGADDHTQYLLTSGARAMAGNLNLGTNAITGLTTLTATGLLQTTATTEQMRLRYDASNYTSFTVGSTGALTIGTTGTGTTTVTNGVNVGTGNGYYIGGDAVVSKAGTNLGPSNTNTGSGLTIGSSNTSSGLLTVATGYSNVSSGTVGSVAMGYINTASGAGSVALGSGNTASGSSSFATGISNTASANNSVAIGKSVTNTTGGSLQIGPSDAAKLTILSSGNVGIGTTSPYVKLSVVGEVVASYFTATSTTATSTFTAGVNVGTGNGYYIGGTSVISNNGKTFGTGNVNTGTGVVLGGLNTGSNNFANAVGMSNTASGFFSNAFGYGNTASAFDSSTFGFGNQATSSDAVAFGFNTSAGGLDSVAIGNTVAAYASNSIAIGKNVTNTTANSLMIGPSNAAKITILSSGNVGIGTTSPYAKLSVAGEVVADYFNATSTTATSTLAGALRLGSDQDVDAKLSITKSGTAGSTAYGTYLSLSGAPTTGYGVYSLARGTTNAYSFYADLTGAGGITNGYGLRTSAVFTGVGITNAYGVYVGSLGATDSSSYGVYVEGMGAGTDRFAVYAAGTTDKSYFGGNVGIGTTSPYAKLSVAGQVVADYFTATSTTATSTFTAGVNVGSGNGYFVNGASAVRGALGTATTFGFSNTVGVTGVAFGNSNTSSALGSAAFGLSNTASSIFAVAFGNSNGASGTNSVAMGYSNIASAANSVAIGKQVNNTIPNSLQIGPSDAAKLTILSTGNVGIGTTSPYAKLSVVGEVVAAHFTATSTTATSTFAGRVILTGTGLEDYSANGELLLLNVDNPINVTGPGNAFGHLRLRSATEHVRAVIDAGTGGCGSNACLAALSFAQSGSLRWGVRKGGGTESAGTNAGSNFQIQSFDDDGYHYGYPLVIERSTGNMLLGLPSATDLPYARLDVRGAGSGANQLIEFSNSASTTVMRLLENGTGYFYGNVGIGTTSPYAKLSVVGEVVASYFTATSTTATSTFANHISIASGKDYRINGNPVLSTNDIGGIVGFGNTYTSSGVAVGKSNSATDAISIAVGYSNIASSIAASAIGSSNTASSIAASAIGYSNSATSSFAVAMGYANNSGGASSVAIGLQNSAYAATSIAMGSNVINTTAGSLMIGPSNTAKLTILSSGNMGIGTTSPYAKLSVIGQVVADYFTATSTTATSTFTAGVNVGTGNGYFIGGNNVLSGSTAGGVVGFGNTNTSSGGIVMGISNSSTGFSGTAIGISNTTSSTIATAIGYGNTASDFFTSAIGYTNTASAFGAVAVGYGNTASASGAVAIGASITNATADSLMIGASDTAKITILSSGNTGIGTTTPFSALTVATGNIGAFNGALCADNGGLSKCYGTLTAGVVYGDSSSFVASDIAENYPVADSALEAGDIVMVASTLTPEEQTKRDNDKEKLTTLYQGETPSSIKETIGTSVEKATIEGGYKVIGVISTAPGVLLGDTTGLALDTAFKPVALSGRVPLKVNNEGGDIKAGDPIALSTTPGVGTKATTASRAFIGTALENFSGTEGKILVFMNLSSARLDTKIAGGTIGKGQSSFWDIDDSTGRLKYIAALDLNDFDIVNVKAINAIGSKWSIDAFGRMVVEEIKTKKLCVGETCVDESMLKKILEKVGIGAPTVDPVIAAPVVTPTETPVVEIVQEPIVVEAESTSAPEESVSTVTPELPSTPEESVSTVAPELPSAPEESVSTVAPESTPTIIEEPVPAPEPIPTPKPVPEPAVIPEAVVAVENIQA